MKYITLPVFTTILLTLLIFPNLQAQESKNNDKATTILDAASSNIQKNKTMKVEFTYIMENKEAKLKESRQGTAFISGEKYRINIAGQVIINDGKTLYTYLPESKEVQINDAAESDNSMSPTSILSSYKKNYRAKFIKEEKAGKSTLMHIDLIPLQGKNFFRIRVVVDNTASMPVSFAIHDKSGSIFTYQIDKLQSNIDIPASMLSFKPSDYPGVEVIDMR
ncbi:MAG: outer membrane lipoprotein carrier protein LolA [Bacteroidales bacterium]|nr:outer membrane lipoprotein carrier protein LolA [Bacteroidales bacterium]